MALSSTPLGSSAAKPGSIKVIIAGDSDVVCKPILASIKTVPEVEIVAQVPTGTLAASRLKQDHADVVVMDIGMQESDGLKAIPRLLLANPDVKIVMVATLTFRNVKISMDGLVAGAVEFVTLPVSRNKKSVDSKFRAELTSKIKALGSISRRPVAVRKAAPLERVDSRLREPSSQRPEVIAIGASTGGPRVLISFFEKLPKLESQAVLITQHMPASFMAQMADHITKAGDWTCTLANDGEVIKAGHIYLAPGDLHMTVTGSSAIKRIRLKDDPPVNYCRPAVDPMFTSIAQVYGNRALGVIFTGMGKDGLAGSRDIVDAGEPLFRRTKNLVSSGECLLQFQMLD